MSAPNSIRTEMAAAVRAVAAAYDRLGVDIRPDVRWSAADDVLEAALAAESRERALEGIREWKQHWFSIFYEATR